MLFYKIWKKYNKIQLTKAKTDLNNKTTTNHPPSPVRGRLDSCSQGSVRNDLHVPPGGISIEAELTAELSI